MDKKPFKIPTMKEIEKIEWNGINVVSTFSGGGGSCLGYRMAGCKVLYANEFVREAQKTYKINHKNSYLDIRDIRKIQPNEILEKIGLKKGEIDILDGSPPCATFSTSGKRQESWGKVKKYSDKKQRVDDLFYEYIRLLRGLQPKVFVAENVKGLVMGTAKGYFKEILKEMKESGYNVKVKLINSLWLGVPQARERVIFIGVRKDLNLEPIFPKPHGYYYNYIDAIPEKIIEDDNAPLKEGTKLHELYLLTKQGDQFCKANKIKYGNSNCFTHRKAAYNKPAATLLQTVDTYHPEEIRTLSISEIKRLQTLPDDFILTGKFVKKWERVGRMVPPIMMKEISKAIIEGVLWKIK